MQVALDYLYFTNHSLEGGGLTVSVLARSTCRCVGHCTRHLTLTVYDWVITKQIQGVNPMMAKHPIQSILVTSSDRKWGMSNCTVWDIVQVT